jgi:hypothetical protein
LFGLIPRHGIEVRCDPKIAGAFDRCSRCDATGENPAHAGNAVILGSPTENAASILNSLQQLERDSFFRHGRACPAMTGSAMGTINRVAAAS